MERNEFNEDFIVKQTLEIVAYKIRLWITLLFSVIGGIAFFVLAKSWILKRIPQGIIKNITELILNITPFILIIALISGTALIIIEFKRRAKEFGITPKQLIFIALATKKDNQ